MEWIETRVWDEMIDAGYRALDILPQKLYYKAHRRKCVILLYNRETKELSLAEVMEYCFNQELLVSVTVQFGDGTVTTLNEEQIDKFLFKWA